MIRSTVDISMQEDNGLSCSYAKIYKAGIQVIIILAQKECAIFNYSKIKQGIYNEYLLLKHYPNTTYSYQDFLKLIGKMCKKIQWLRIIE